MSDFQIDIDATVEFLVGLLNIPSPTGYYVEAMNFVEAQFSALNLPNFSISRAPKGSLHLLWGDAQASVERALTAHVDTLGLMVKDIKPNGRLKTTLLGGFMWNAVEFEGVTVRTRDDRRIRGTCLPANPSTHVNRDVAKATRDADLMEIRLDAITSSAAETRALGIEVGDFVFLDPRVETSDSGYIRSRHLDDKAGVACLYGAALALKNAGKSPSQPTLLHIANYEEVGHGGAFGLPSTLQELVAIDMAAIGDGQNSDEHSATICVKDSGGPYHFELTEKLHRIADKHEIPVKRDIYPYYGSDGTAYWRSGGGAQVALIGPGVDASHAYERTHRDALRDTTNLIAHYLLD